MIYSCPLLDLLLSVYSVINHKATQLQVFRKLDNERRGRVSVFFCGPPAISKILKSKCAQYRFEFRKEHF